MCLPLEPQHGQVPSGFYLADCMLELDRNMGGTLLVPKFKQLKRDVAADEAKRLKRLMGALRHLYRNCFLTTGICAKLAPVLVNICNWNLRHPPIQSYKPKSEKLIMGYYGILLSKLSKFILVKN